MVWKPGQSGNPRGRPSLNGPFRAFCREYMDKAGWEKIVDLASNASTLTPPAVQLHALELIAAYGYGKPTQPITGDQEAGPLAIEVIYADAAPRGELVYAETTEDEWRPGGRENGHSSSRELPSQTAAPASANGSYSDFVRRVRSRRPDDDD